MSEEYKTWLVIRRDLNIPAGKLAVQSGHAFSRLTLHCLMTLDVSEFREYFLSSGCPKIVTMVRNENDLLRVYRECEKANIPCSLIRDAGRTVFGEPTNTVCAFGPHKRSQLPPFLKRLRLYED